MNNKNKGGGWTLLMSHIENSKTFHYESEHWEKSTVVNDMNYNADNQKHGAFNTMKFDEFLAVFPEFTQGHYNLPPQAHAQLHTPTHSHNYTHPCIPRTHNTALTLKVAIMSGITKWINR